ncbi:fatty acid-binding protein DegV [Clostridium novyi A str. 4552]|uniref:Fatty acid-binding protein DegV n=1 Tax=Clostridium novyi A str. 4552 TaxID=1444289 RepID=A0A0A0I926_CLONO|nr:DegV family protein [Clostridium novyi]KGM96130.1 fatty acid-binding protein DegV [Clostridium novyi A str. 4552]
MDIKIVADSSCDLSQELKEEMNIDIAPLTLILEDKEYVDNEDLNILEYIENMKKCKTAPKTACPSPQDYMEKYKGEESVLVVPLSSKLSGSYNSAVLAKNLFLDEIGNKFIHVFDSVTASVGQTIISLKINELSKLNLGEFEIVEKVNKYISEMKTFFLLESLDHLAKAGRLNPIIAKVANMLSIKPIMGSNDDGTIRLVEKTRGYKKAFKRFIDIIGEEGSNLEQKVLGIAHCNCLERALKFKEEVLKRYNFKDIVVVEMSGLSTTYADDGGLVIAF